jgi:hypothetical protein
MWLTAQGPFWLPRRSSTPSPDRFGVPSWRSGRDPARGRARRTFAAFVLATGAALVVLGVTLAASGVIAVPVAWLTALIPVVVLLGQTRSGDSIPAVLYLPTMLVGLALLLG